MKFLSKSLEETAKISSDFASELYRRAPSATATIVGLYGELGSGKTTFMKYLAESFGIKDTIQSPTFVIEKIYNLTPTPLLEAGEGRKKWSVFKKFIHIDAYRIEKEEEMLNLEWKQIIADPKNLICIEWPERIAKIMPEHIIIKFEHVRENERKISIT